MLLIYILLLSCINGFILRQKRSSLILAAKRCNVIDKTGKFIGSIPLPLLQQNPVSRATVASIPDSASSTKKSSTSFHLHFDGGAAPNGRDWTAGAIVHSSSNATWDPMLHPGEQSGLLWQGQFYYASSGEGTMLRDDFSSLDAEYMALIEGLYGLIRVLIARREEEQQSAAKQLLTNKGFRNELDIPAPIQIHGDSQIALLHLHNNYKNKKQFNTRRLFRLAHALLKSLGNFYDHDGRSHSPAWGAGMPCHNLTHVNREGNALADSLARSAGRYQRSSIKIPNLASGNLRQSQGGVLLVSFEWPHFSTELLPSSDQDLLNESLRTQYQLLRLNMQVCGIAAELSLQLHRHAQGRSRGRKATLNRRTAPYSASHRGYSVLGENDRFFIDLMPGLLPETDWTPLEVTLTMRDQSRLHFLKQEFVSIDVDALARTSWINGRFQCQRSMSLDLNGGDGIMLPSAVVRLVFVPIDPVNGDSAEDHAIAWNRAASAVDSLYCGDGENSSSAGLARAAERSDRWQWQEHIREMRDAFGRRGITYEK